MRALKSIINITKHRITSYSFAKHDCLIDRHVIVFESDDWGSIRMSNRRDWDELLRKGYSVDKRPYERYDTLESPEDLAALFDVLRKHTDAKGNHPVITANMLMANPDFERIKDAGYTEYYFEPISKTYGHYYGNTKVLDLMRQGLEEGVYMPQSHGREHFNVRQWLKGLQSGNQDLLTAFQYCMCGIAPKLLPELGNQMMKALLAETDEEERAVNSIVVEGLKMFELLWGFKSKTFVAPCYLWSTEIEKSLADNGVELLQTARSSKPAYKTPSRYYYSGQRNTFGQIYSVRNCRFEPATNDGGASLDALMKQVDEMFKKGKPCVFSTHRINYVGGIDEGNRKRTLDLLDAFLKHLLQKYPDTEFLSSDQLIEVYK